MKLVIMITTFLLTYSIFACEGGGNCCTTPECIEQNYLSNQGINELRGVVNNILTHQSKMKDKIVKITEKEELTFLDKLANNSTSPILKDIYKSCKKRILNNYKEQVEREFKLDYYDYIGGYESAKDAVISLKETREYRTEPEGSNNRRYKTDLRRISKFLQNKRIDSFKDELSHYHFYAHRKSCDFSSLFKKIGEKPTLYNIDFNLDFTDLKSKKYQKLLEKLSKKKKTNLNFNLKCFFGKNKVIYKKKKNELYIEAKGKRKGPKSCNDDAHEMSKLPGMYEGTFDLNIIKIAHESKAFLQ